MSLTVDDEKKEKNNFSIKICLYFLIAISILILLLSILIKFILNSNKNNTNDTNTINDTNNIQNNILEFNIKVGIDFGSTSSGYYIIFDPLDEKDIKYDVISSQILLDKTDKIGLRIGENAYERFKVENNKTNFLYFTAFKRNLDPKINKNLVKSDFPGDEIELKIVIKEFMKKMREEAEGKIKERKSNYNLNEIKWIITIPPLWDIKGKKIMEEAAKKVGMANLDVILEPEASSLSLFKEDNKIIKEYIKKDKTFLIVDAGGYTVDFSANRILDDNNLEQLMIPVSIVNGSSLINEKIFNILKRFVGEEKVKNVDYQNIKTTLDYIEEKKKEVDLNEGGNLKLDIRPFDIYCKSESFFSYILSIYYSSPDYCTQIIDGKELTYDNNALLIPKKYISEIINQLITNILFYVDHLLAKLDHIDLIVFTGGFSTNKIFREKIEEYKKGHNSEIIFMEEPQMTVMKGAALFGLKPTQILKRIIPITIGIASYETKKQNETCDNDDEFFDENKNETRCHKYLTFVRKKESIEMNQIINKEIHISEERIYIYYNYENEITKESSKYTLGYIDSSFGESDDNFRSFNLTMKFTNYINVSIIDENLNEQNSTLLIYPNDKYQF